MRFTTWLVVGIVLVGCTNLQVVDPLSVNLHEEQVKSCAQAEAEWRLLNPSSPGSTPKSLRSALELRFQKYYPQSALKSKKAVCVVVAFDVTKEGLADHIRVVFANPNDGRFTNAALLATFEDSFPKQEYKNASRILAFGIGGEKAHTVSEN